MNDRVRSALEYLESWVVVASPTDIENFYNNFTTVCGVDSRCFMFIGSVPIWCANFAQCRLARRLNERADQGDMLMRSYDGFVIRNRLSGELETIRGGDCLEIFSSSPIIKVVPKSSIAACDLHKENKRSNSVCITNNLNDYTITTNSGELQISPNGVRFLEKRPGGWEYYTIATTEQMLGLYGNGFCTKLFNFLTKETKDPIERMCQKRLREFLNENFYL